eukprot:11985845-Heterocapsa_arctica.AAC.1
MPVDVAVLRVREAGEGAAACPVLAHGRNCPGSILGTKAVPAPLLMRRRSRSSLHEAGGVVREVPDGGR